MKTAVATLICACTATLVTAQEPRDREETFRITPTGYAQFDIRAFPDWDVTPGVGRLNRSTAEVRRLRAGIDGSWRRLTFQVSVDPMDDDGVFVKDAYAQIRLSRSLRLRAGQFKVPGTRDYEVSARRLDFLERPPLVTSLGVGRDIGARVDGGFGSFRYDVGIFAGDGIGRVDRAGLTAAGRATVRLSRDLEVGGSASDARTQAVDSQAPAGTSLRTTSGYRFADGVYVEGQRLRLGADIEWSPGRWRFSAETLRLRDERLGQGLDHEDLPPAIGSGFSASAIRRLRLRQNGARESPLDLFRRPPADVGIRYDYIGVDDSEPATGTDSVRPRATDIRKRAAHTLTLGSTWSLSNWTRLLGNVGLERYDEARSAPEAGRPGTYLSLGARLQLEWP